MLVSLSIQQFVIVDRLELDLESGFTVMTGETGAGKSILVDALDLLLGGRADARMVREGATKAELCGQFHVPALTHVQGWLADADLASEDDPHAILIRRTIDGQGKSKAWINGHSATLAQLKELGEQLVDIHGQHAHQALLKPNAQRELLDAQAGLTAQTRALSELWRARQKLSETLAVSRQQAAQLQDLRDQLTWVVDEIESLHLAPNEWATLSEEQKRLSHAAELLQASQAAVNAIDEEEPSLLGQIEKFAVRLRQLTEKDPRLIEAAEALEATGIQLHEAANVLRRYLDKTDLDPERLADVDARVEAIFSAARKLKTKPEALVDLLDSTRERLAKAEQASDTKALEKQLAALDADYTRLARELSAQRKRAGTALSTSVNTWFEQLAMGGMVFEVALEPRDTPAAFGLEDVVFTLRNHAGGAPFPIQKVASGGELARISLAIAVVTTSATTIPTLIFDEVDTGIGGNVAHTIGRLLRQLGDQRQVLCVTHLPQVAAKGHHHLRVIKSTSAGKTPTSGLQHLDEEERIQEIARMLGDQGAEKTSREHARSLLALS